MALTWKLGIQLYSVPLYYFLVEPSMALPLANCNSVIIVFGLHLRKPSHFNYKIIWISKHRLIKLQLVAGSQFRHWTPFT